MDNEIRPAQAALQEPRFALRLTYRYDGDNVSLARRERVQMIAPPAGRTPPVAGENSGFWVELRDANGRVLYHRVLHNPIPFVAEVHSPEGTIRAVSAPPGRGEFQVLVPDLPDGAAAVLYGSPLDTRRALEPARELVRVALGDERGKEQQP
jgi:hypothetical protein